MRRPHDRMLWRQPATIHLLGRSSLKVLESAVGATRTFAVAGAPPPGRSVLVLDGTSRGGTRLKTRSLCSLLTRKQIEFGSDFDATPDSALVRVLADRTGLDPATLHSDHTLAGFTGRLFPRLTRGKGTPWILPLGPFYALHPAMQYCPLCLREPQAYYRRIWRLSLFSVCPAHGVGLRHICPGCTAPIHPLKNDLRWRDGAITRCWNCGFDLRDASAETVDEVDLKLSREMLDGLRAAMVPAGFPEAIGVTAYLAGLALVCAKLLRRQPRLTRWREVAAKEAGDLILPSPVGRRLSTSFNSLAHPAERRAVLRVAAFLFRDWPQRFLEIASASGTRTSDFAAHFAAAPAWFLEPLQARLTPPRRKPVPSTGLLKVRQMREFILEHRREWSPSKMPRLIRALRAAGFYSAQTDDCIIMRSLPKTIARLRVEGSNYRRRLTKQVARGTREWSSLLLLAKPYRKAHCKNAEILRRGIKLLCRDRFLSSADLGELLHRSHVVLMAFHLTPLARTGELQTRFGRNRVRLPRFRRHGGAWRLVG